MSDQKWDFVAPYLALLAEDAGQRRYPPREMFNVLRWLAHGLELVEAHLLAEVPLQLAPHE